MLNAADIALPRSAICECIRVHQGVLVTERQGKLYAIVHFNKVIQNASPKTIKSINKIRQRTKEQRTFKKRVDNYYSALKHSALYK